VLRFCANLSMMFAEADLPFRFAAARRAGFDGVELHDPYVAPAARLARWVKDAGVVQVLINAPAGDRDAGDRGIACIAARQPEFRASIDKALDYAVALGRPLVHVMAGAPHTHEPHATLRRTYVENLRWAAERATSAGVGLTIEAMNLADNPGYFLCTQELAAEVAESVPGVGLQFDVYHCQVSQGGVTRRLESLMPLIAHVQIADAPLRSEPWTGEINWAHIFATLESLGYEGWIGAEYRPMRGTVEGLGWLDAYRAMPRTEAGVSAAAGAARSRRGGRRGPHA
jgi:hydroxypyruvate isomerase